MIRRLYWCLICLGVLLWVLPYRMACAGESRTFLVPEGRKARIIGIDISPGKGFRIIETVKGWTVYRSWGDPSAVSGLVLAPGRYKAVSEGDGPVEVDFKLEEGRGTLNKD